MTKLTVYFAYYNNIPIGEIINSYTIDPLSKWLGNSNNDQWISQPFLAAVNSPVPAVMVISLLQQEILSWIDMVVLCKRSVISIPSIILSIMSFSFQLASLDDIKIFLLTWWQIRMEMTTHVRGRQSVRANTSNIAYFPV